VPVSLGLFESSFFSSIRQVLIRMDDELLNADWGREWLKGILLNANDGKYGQVRVSALECVLVLVSRERRMCGAGRVPVLDAESRERVRGCIDGLRRDKESGVLRLIEKIQMELKM